VQLDDVPASLLLLPAARERPAAAAAAGMLLLAPYTEEARANKRTQSYIPLMLRVLHEQYL
jgi:hypothetical protein